MKRVIIEKMQEKNISQVELAERIGVKQQYISKILLGKIKSPGFKLMIRIADALEISLDELR